PAAARHQSTSEFINDDHFTVFYDVINVALKNRMSLQRLLHMVQGIDLARIIKIVHAQQAFYFGNTRFGQSHRAALFIHRIVALGLDGGAILLGWITLNHGTALQLGDDAVDDIVLVRGFFRRSGNDQRGSGLVDQDIVHFIDDNEVELSLDVLIERE